MTPLITTYLSITTIVGCPVQCLKYCPQELIVASYKGDKAMTLDMFRSFISTVPASTDLYIGGFSEPLVNQEAVAMMEWASTRGHRIRLFTTLVGFKREDVERLCRIPYEMVVLHLPDAFEISHIPITDEYLYNLGYITKHVKNLRFMNMGDLDFITNHREDVARGIDWGWHTTNKRFCAFMESPRYELMPNGEVYFCCECSCLTMRVGSLYENTYPELAAKHEALSRQYRNDMDSLCSRCCLSQSYYKAKTLSAIMRTKDTLTGGIPIKDTRVFKILFGRLF
jgi:hypothetical protein